MQAWGPLLTLYLFSASFVAWAQHPAATQEFERGTLTKGLPTGMWEYFDDAGQLELRMNYDSSRISYRRPDTARYELQVGGTWQLVHPSRAPGPMGSRAGRSRALQKQLHYPVSALQQQLQGDVILSYLVGTDGHTSSYLIEHSLSLACDQEVWRVLQQLPDRWIPAIYQSKPVVARFYLAVRFEMKQADRLAQATTQPNPPLSGRTPPYTDHIVVTAVGIERSVRLERQH